MQHNQTKQQQPHYQHLQTCSTSLALSWTSLAQETKQKGIEPLERYLHSAAMVAGKLHVLGGADSKGPIKNNVIDH